MFAAIDAAQLLPEIEAALALASIVAAWAFLRPSMVRDFNNRPLPPNPTARLMFVALCVFGYGVLVVSFHVFGEFTDKLSISITRIPFISSIVEYFRGQAPLLAIITFGGLLQLSVFREFERGLLAWLHSTGHLHQDSKALSAHLARCEFLPTDDEKRSYRELARRFGVYVTSDFDTVGVVTFQGWRKVATLLRLVRQWNPRVGGGTLGEEDMRLLAELETAHERKTQLAMTIVKLVERAERGGEGSAKSLSELLKLINKDHQSDPSAVQDLEVRARSLLKSSHAGGEGPLHLTGEEFKTFLAQIESYFQVEYAILLEEIADLAARSVVLSGEAAPDRLQLLRQLGFSGLGVIEPIDINRFIWIFMIVSIGGFLVMFIGTQGDSSRQGPPPVEMLARFAFVMALASLVGAFTGSKRSLAGAAQTPWGAYVVGGLVAVALFVAVNVFVDLVKQANAAIAAASTVSQETTSGVKPDTLALQSASESPAPYQPRPIRKRLPWAALPFFLVIALCRLARLEEWPGLRRNGEFGRIGERFADGLVLSLTMLVGFYLAIGIHQALGIDLPPRLQASLAAKGMFGIGLSSPLVIFGFLIGFFVVSDIRRAAHARIIASPIKRGKIEFMAPDPRVLASRA